MFDLGMQEILVALVVALIFIGPKRLPEIARTLGKAMGELRRAGDELKEQIDLAEMMDVREETPERERQTSPGPDKDHSEAPSSPPFPGDPPEGTQPAHAEDQKKTSEKTEA
jgi:sec-independent protein translocase protein TatB